MSIFYIFLALVMLGVIIFLHEFGHYIAGRLLGIGIVEFAIGMGPKLFGWKRTHRVKGTREEETIQYSLRLLPLGGYCAFLGEDASDAAPRAMNNQPAWKRILTVAAGPVMNFVVAFVLSVGLIASGQISDPYRTETLPIVTGVIEGMPAEQAGFEPLDVITGLDGIPITPDGAGAGELKQYLSGIKDGQSVEVTVRRASESARALWPEQGPSLETLLSDAQDSVVLTLAPVRQQDGSVLLGVYLSSRYASYDCGFFGAIPESLKFMWNTAKATYEMLGTLVKNLFTGGDIPEGSVSGVVGIVAGVSDGLKTGFGHAFAEGVLNILFYIMAISLSLGIMNLLPLPALDGGRLVLLLIEWITGKHFSRKTEGYINIIGLMLLLAIMLVVTYFDIRSL